MIDSIGGIATGKPEAVPETPNRYNTDIKPVNRQDSKGYSGPFEANNPIEQIRKNIDRLARVIVDARGNVVSETGSCGQLGPGHFWPVGRS